MPYINIQAKDTQILCFVHLTNFKWQTRTHSHRPSEGGQANVGHLRLVNEGYISECRVLLAGRSGALYQLGQLPTTGAGGRGGASASPAQDSYLNYILYLVDILVLVSALSWGFFLDAWRLSLCTICRRTSSLLHFTTYLQKIQSCYLHLCFPSDVQHQVSVNQIIPP